jgi:hypothetical protein
VITEMEAIYRLAVIVRDHLRRSEDSTDTGVLPSDSVGGLIREIEAEWDASHNTRSKSGETR